MLTRRISQAIHRADVLERQAANLRDYAQALILVRWRLQHPKAV
jgi:hypothetical protein